MVEQRILLLLRSLPCCQEPFHWEIEVPARLSIDRNVLQKNGLSLAAKAARAAGAETRLGERAESIYQAPSDKGFDGLDFSGVMKDVKGLI